MTWFLGLLAIGSSLLGIALFHPDMLLRDEWPIYNRLVQDHLWKALWVSWHGHRLVFPGLMEYANLVWFRVNLSNLVIFNIAAITTCAWLLGRAGGAALQHRSSRWLLLILALAILLWLGNPRAIKWANGLTYTLCLLGAVAGCFSMAHSKAVSSGALRWPWLILTLACAILASFSYGSGLVMWPVLVLMALALRLPMRGILSVAITGSIVITAYFIPTAADNGLQVSLPGNFSEIAKMVFLVLGVLGNMPTHLLAPFAQVDSDRFTLFALSIGFVGLLLICGLVYEGWRSGQRRLLFLASVSVFMVGTAVSVGLVRYGPASFWWDGHYGIIPRFRIYSSFLWVTLLCGYIPLLSRYLPSRQSRLVSTLIPALVLLLILPSQWNDFIRAGERKNNFEEAALAYADGFTKDAFRARFARPPSQVPGIYQYLKQNRLNLFSHPWSRWTGTLLTGMDTAKDTIRGGLTTIDSLKPGWRIQGWVAAPHPDTIIVGVDRRGAIQAVARLTQPLYSSRMPAQPFRTGWLQFLHIMEPNLPAILGWGRGWYGYARHTSSPRSLRYFVVTPDKRIIGRLVQPLDPS